MVCQGCGAREATVLVQTVVNNHVKKAALCATCASGHTHEEPIDALAAALAALSGRSRGHPARCPACRSTFADFRESGRFGCPSCYDAFRSQVGDLLPRLHGGAYHHRGKTPGRR